MLMVQAVKIIHFTEVMMMATNAKVINIMADGTICKDLSTYLKSPEQLSLTARRLIAHDIHLGQESAVPEESGTMITEAT